MDFLLTTRHYRTFPAYSGRNFVQKKMNMKREKLPVSRKFYADITLRINSTLAGLPDSAEEAQRLVSCHLHGENTGSSDSLALVAFNMIRPEIDRAMERSRRARERAARRKNMAGSATLIPTVVEETVVPADVPAATEIELQEEIKEENTEMTETTAGSPADTTAQPRKLSRSQRRRAARRRKKLLQSCNETTRPELSKAQER